MEILEKTIAQIREQFGLAGGILVAVKASAMQTQKQESSMTTRLCFRLHPVPRHLPPWLQVSCAMKAR